MEKRRKFFVRSEDEHTNEVISRIPGTSFSELKMVWECDFNDVLNLLKSKSHQALEFKVFIDFGDDKLHPFKIQPAKHFQTVVSQMKTRLAILQHNWEKQNAA